MNTFVKVFTGRISKLEDEANNYAKKNNCYIVSTSISNTGYGCGMLAVVYCRNKTHEH